MWPSSANQKCPAFHKLLASNIEPGKLWEPFGNSDSCSELECPGQSCSDATTVFSIHCWWCWQYKLKYLVLVTVQMALVSQAGYFCWIILGIAPVYISCKPPSPSPSEILRSMQCHYNKSLKKKDQNLFLLLPFKSCDHTPFLKCKFVVCPFLFKVWWIYFRILSKKDSIFF